MRCVNTLLTRHRWHYDTWALHAGYLRLQAQSEYIIIIAFSWHQWLHESVSMWGYAYTDCLVSKIRTGFKSSINLRVVFISIFSTLNVFQMHMPHTNARARAHTHTHTPHTHTTHITYTHHTPHTSHTHTTHHTHHIHTPHTSHTHTTHTTHITYTHTHHIQTQLTHHTHTHHTHTPHHIPTPNTHTTH